MVPYHAAYHTQKALQGGQAEFGAGAGLVKQRGMPGQKMLQGGAADSDMEWEELAGKKREGGGGLDRVLNTSADSRRQGDQEKKSKSKSKLDVKAHATLESKTRNGKVGSEALQHAGMHTDDHVSESEGQHANLEKERSKSRSNPTTKATSQHVALHTDDHVSESGGKHANPEREQSKSRSNPTTKATSQQRERHSSDKARMDKQHDQHMHDDSSEDDKPSKKSSKSDKNPSSKSKKHAHQPPTESMDDDSSDVDKSSKKSSKSDQNPSSKSKKHVDNDSSDDNKSSKKLSKSDKNSKSKSSKDSGAHHASINSDSDTRKHASRAENKQKHGKNAGIQKSPDIPDPQVHKLDMSDESLVSENMDIPLDDDKSDDSDSEHLSNTGQVFDHGYGKKVSGQQSEFKVVYKGGGDEDDGVLDLSDVGDDDEQEVGYCMYACM